MKAVQLHSYGDTDQLRLADLDDPVPGEGEVLIEVAAAGLNPVDEHVRLGWMAQYVPLALPAVLGVDAAGTVLSVGPGVAGFAAGDRIVAHLPLNGKGAYAERAVAPLAGLARLPDALSFEQAAALPLAGLTGRQAVDALGVRGGERVLVSGALGAVGRSAIQYLKELGAVPVAGARAARLAEAEAVAGEAIDIEAAAHVAAFDHAVSAAASVAASVPALVRDGGKVASPVRTPAEANADGRVTIIQIITRDDQAQLQEVVEAAARGALSIPVVRSFALGEIAQAHGALAEGAGGKLVLRP